MASFQQTIIFCAIVILIISFIFISFTLIYGKKNGYWNPVIGDCPDYWIDISGNGDSCVNVKNLGTCKPADGNKHLTMNFNSSIFTDTNSKCAKYNWANSCGLSWDGITYGVSNPCETE